MRWGVAFSSTQAEGAAFTSDWFAWEQSGAAVPSLDGNGFAVDYADDFALFAQHGLGVVRLTLEWARLEPSEGHRDAAVVERYRDVLMAARDAGLEPWVTLVDRTLPGWFSVDERGWRDRRARGYFWPRHVEGVAEAFGDLAAGWVPIARAISAARAAFLTGAAPPGDHSPQRFFETVAGAHLAALGAWRILRGGTAPTAACYELAPVRAADHLVGSAQMTRVLDALHWGWAEGFRDGVIVVPGLTPLQVPDMRDAFDVIGLTFEGTLIAGADGSVGVRHLPEDLLATLHRAAEDGPERPLWVLGQTVAGSGEPKEDAERLADALAQVDAARADGIPLAGWLWEPAIDGYELVGPADRRLGLFDRERTPRPAAEVLAARIGPAAVGQGMDGVTDASGGPGEPDGPDLGREAGGEGDSSRR
jgi:beta-glucosidase